MQADAAPPSDLLLRLLRRFQEEGVEYVLIEGQAVRLNGFVRATEDADVLLRASRSNGEKVIRALSFLASSVDLEPAWFEPHPEGEIENIRVADELLVDLLFAANGETQAARRTALTSNRRNARPQCGSALPSLIAAAR